MVFKRIIQRIKNNLIKRKIKKENTPVTALEAREGTIDFTIRRMTQIEWRKNQTQTIIQEIERNPTKETVIQSTRALNGILNNILNKSPRTRYNNRIQEINDRIIEVTRTLIKTNNPELFHEFKQQLNKQFQGFAETEYKKSQRNLLEIERQERTEKGYANFIEKKMANNQFNLSEIKKLIEKIHNNKNLNNESKKWLIFEAINSGLISGIPKRQLIKSIKLLISEAEYEKEIIKRTKKTKTI